MRHIKLMALIILGFVGIWLLLWDLIDFLTQGLNDGIWDFAIIQHAFPSIATGICIIIIVSFLGVSVLKG